MNIIRLTYILKFRICCQMMMQQIRMLLDQVEEEHTHALLDTVCMIDECNRIDKMLEQSLRDEGIDIEVIEMEEEIEAMIIEDIEYWDRVYKEFDNYYYDEYEQYDDYI